MSAAKIVASAKQQQFGERGEAIKITIAVLFIFLLTLTAVGQDKKWTGFTEVQLNAEPGKVDPQINLSADHPITKRTGVSVWVQVSRSYSQGYLMATYAPKTWLTVSAGAGLEQAPGLWRTGGFVWIGKGKFSNFLVLEHGASGPWAKNIANIQTHANLGVGVTAERFKGVGPHVQWGISKRLQLHSRLYLGSSTPKAQVTLRYIF